MDNLELFGLEGSADFAPQFGIAGYEGLTGFALPNPSGFSTPTFTPPTSVLATHDNLLAGQHLLHATSDGGGEQLIGTDGNDQLSADSHDRVFGGPGDDILDASKGKGGNRLQGGKGNDDLYATVNDRLFGGEGDDLLFGGGGSNRLTGGQGADQFWIAEFGQIPNTPNRLTDFQVGTDFLGVGRGVGIGSLDDLELVQNGADTLIKVKNSGQEIAVLKGVQLGALTNTSFIFSDQLLATDSLIKPFTVTTEESPIPTLPPGTPISGTSIPALAQEHVPITTQVTYNSNPPTSGPHYEYPAAWGIYRQAPVDEFLVHNLEHGGVIISYNPDLIKGQQLKSLRAQAQELSTFNPRLIVTPRLNLDTAIALTSWGYLEKLDTYDPTAVKLFYDQHIARGPECQDGRCPG